MRVYQHSFDPSSARWSLFLGPLGRGFLILRNTLLFASIVLTLNACGSVDVAQYSGEEPSFEPTTFFSGFLTAHGVVKDFKGDVIRRFNADITACWQDGVGTLDEQFVFDDGEEQVRVWTLVPSGDQRFIATAGDVVGEGQATWAGNAFFLDYTLRVALDDSTIDLHIDDRMYRVSDTVVMNESAMTKFGVGVGGILLTIIRHPDQDVACEQS